jgi:hypothetical protein
MDYKKTDLLSSITKRTAETVPDSLSEADRAFFVNQVQSLKETQSRVFPAIFSKAANRLLGEVTQIYDQVRGEGAPDRRRCDFSRANTQAWSVNTILPLVLRCEGLGPSQRPLKRWTGVARERRGRRAR